MYLFVYVCKNICGESVYCLPIASVYAFLPPIYDPWIPPLAFWSLWSGKVQRLPGLKDLFFLWSYHTWTPLSGCLKWMGPVGVPLFFAGPLRVFFTTPHWRVPLHVFFNLVWDSSLNIFQQFMCLKGKVMTQMFLETRNGSRWNGSLNQNQVHTLNLQCCHTDELISDQNSLLGWLISGMKILPSYI